MIASSFDDPWYVIRRVIFLFCKIVDLSILIGMLLILLFTIYLGRSQNDIVLILASCFWLFLLSLNANLLFKLFLVFLLMVLKNSLLLLLSGPILICLPSQFLHIFPLLHLLFNLFLRICIIQSLRKVSTMIYFFIEI